MTTQPSNLQNLQPSFAEFYSGKRVFITGHTGFKGSWLCLWLHLLGAEVTGYALNPPTEPNLFELCKIDNLVNSIIRDVRDLADLNGTMAAAKPEIVIHMAAQPLVRDSYKIPVETYAINVMGAVNLFDAVRNCNTVKAVINVTTDKVYENREWIWGYRESEPLGGYDPYASSKACSELVTSAYKNSYFNPADHEKHGVGIASVRAGNVIGGGDWATDRLIPDCIRSMLEGAQIVIRNPHAVRPWQHVLDPLSGYLMLAQKLVQDGPLFSDAWNFGPDDSDAKPVAWLVKKLCTKWGRGATYAVDKGAHPHESHYLKLDSSKAKSQLGWQPRWNLEKAVDSIIEWTLAYQNSGNLKEICLEQIKEYSMNEGAA
ncbi:MAG TPA: CDP-glucose 4,6-dehydratase [Nitrospiraceae bacterium]|nr:CDP-glucose 4,6-dehydratase [Nitrospiraceae bacterium]